jgi:hypothetical protein
MEDIEINNNNEDHGVCVKEKMDALSFSSNYIKTKYVKPCMQRLGDDLYEESHPSPPSHGPISHYCSVSEDGDGLWEAYLKILEEMDKESGEEESSHFSIKNQDTIEDQRDEEKIVSSDIQEPTIPPPDESTDQTIYIPFQSVDCHDTSCSDSEGDDLVGSSSQYGKHNGMETNIIDAFLCLDRCKWDASNYYFDNYTIYDIENNEHEIAEFWPHEKPSLATSFHI